MNKNELQQLLQICLEGYDAGLTPEECLSVYPEARDELEPLLRQALSLRFAYAAPPSEEFRSSTREKLMFAAGRDVGKVLASDPDPDFVSQTRQRLLNAAGAGAQEALRDVPPPRLPFWANARRRLLETASTPRPRPASTSLFGVRSALSAAVVVLAVGVAGAGFFLNSAPANEPRTANADLEYIEEQVELLEQRRSRGEIIPPGEIEALAQRTALLYDQAPNLDKFPEIIDRQQDFIEDMESPGNDNAVLAAAHETLTETEQKVDDSTAMVESPIPTATTESTTLTEPEPTETPDATSTAEPSPTAEPTTEPTQEPLPVISPEDLDEDQILIQPEADDNTQDLEWSRVSTTTISFLIESGWEPNYEVDENGLAVMASPGVVLNPDSDNDDSRINTIFVSTNSGEVIAIIDGEQVTLRSEGPDGEPMDPAKLEELTEDLAPALYYFLTSIELMDDADNGDDGETETYDSEDEGEDSDENSNDDDVKELEVEATP